MLSLKVLNPSTQRRPTEEPMMELELPIAMFSGSILKLLLSYQPEHDEADGRFGTTRRNLWGLFFTAIAKKDFESDGGRKGNRPVVPKGSELVITGIDEFSDLTCVNLSSGSSCVIHIMQPNIDDYLCISQKKSLVNAIRGTITADGVKLDESVTELKSGDTCKILRVDFIGNVTVSMDNCGTVGVIKAKKQAVQNLEITYCGPQNRKM